MHLIKGALKARELNSLMFLLAMFAIVGIVNPLFLSPNNMFLIVNGSVVFTVIAVGSAFVIMSGEIDVSVGATMGIAAAVSGSMIRDGQPWAMAIVTVILLGAFIGLINGFGVVFVKIPSIVMTLGAMGIIRGLSYVYTDGRWVENMPFEFKALAQSSIGPISWFYLGAIIFVIIAFIFQSRSRIGKYIKAVGDNENGAVLVGIPVKSTKIISFMICGVLAAISGVMFASRVGFVTPGAGSGYEMKAIAACVLGGISLTGGVGSVIGAAIGAVIMSSISRLLVFLQLSSDLDNTITGILLIIIVVADRLLYLRSAEKARKNRMGARTKDMEDGAK